MPIWSVTTTDNCRSLLHSLKQTYVLLLHTPQAKKGSKRNSSGGLVDLTTTSNDENEEVVNSLADSIGEDGADGE